MKRPRRIPTAIIGLTLAAALIAGCSSSGGSGDNDVEELTIWLPPLGADDAINEQLAAFTAETGIEVTVEAQNWETYFQDLTTALTTGEGPDVAAIGNTWTASFAPVGGLVEFDEAAFEAIGGKDRFLAAPLTSTAPPGETPIAVPWMAFAYGLIYSKSAFAAAGITEPPETWDDFIEAGKALTQDGRYGTSYTGASVAGPSSTLLWAIIRQHGGDLFDADGSPTFNTPEVQAAVQTYLSWFAEGIANPASAEYVNNNEPAEDLASGVVGMVVLENPAAAAAAAAGMDPADIGVAPTPIIEGGPVVRSHVAGINLVVFESSAKKEAATELVKFLSTAEAQVPVNEAGGGLPVVNDAYDNEVFSTEANDVFGATVAEESEALPMVPQQGQMQTILGTAVNRLIAQIASTGSVTEEDIASALEEANQQMAALG